MTEAVVKFRSAEEIAADIRLARSGNVSLVPGVVLAKEPEVVKALEDIKSTNSLNEAVDATFLDEKMVEVAKVLKNSGLDTQQQSRVASQLREIFYR